jgi:hypothetical protein
MFKALFFSIYVAFIAGSCNNKPIKSNQSNDAVNHIAIIIDDEWWSGEVGDSLRNKFAGPTIGLPEEEPLFTINQYPLKLLEGFISDNRSIIVVKRQVRSKYQITQSGRNKNQQIIYLCGNTVPEVVSLLEQNTLNIISRVRARELIYMRTLLDSGLNYTPILNNINLQLKLPKSYKQVFRGDGFSWFKKDIIGGNMNVLVYQVLLNDKNIVPNIQKTRDSIGIKYIHGTAEESNMLTAGGDAPYSKYTAIDAHKAIETRGTWELKNDFMTGPFLNYAIFCPEQNKLFFVEGFCYAPSKNKRDLMFELETIIRSIKIRDGYLAN